MEVKLEVIVSSSIKRKKPWSRFSWLGQATESIFMLDDKRVSEINLVTGRKKKKNPKFSALMKNVINLATSTNGAWLIGLLASGELFLWNKDHDCLKMTSAADGVSQVMKPSHEYSKALGLFVSGDGMRVLLANPTGHVLLWESHERKDLTTVVGTLVTGQWSQILHPKSVILPANTDKETSVHAAFTAQECVGDCCFCSFAFTAEEKLVVTFMTIQWFEKAVCYSSKTPFRVKWTTKKYSLARLIPACASVKSRGALPTALSGDGLILSIAVNQNNPKASQVLFVSTTNFVTVSSNLKGCGSKNSPIFLSWLVHRSYWVSDMAWTCNDLYLACLLKRGALLFLSRLGDLLTLTTYGCSVEFGPAQYIPLHPLINFRPPQSELKSFDYEDAFGSDVSLKDEMRQRFSVNAHWRLPYLIVSDGYMVTVLNVSSNFLPSAFMSSILQDTRQRLKKIRQTLMLSQPQNREKLKQLSSINLSSVQDEEFKAHAVESTPQFLQEDYEAQEKKNNDCSGDESNEDSLSLCDFAPEVQSGHIEFASMFDTIHAIPDLTAESSDTSAQIPLVQKNLLMNKMDQNKTLKRDAWMYPILQIFKYFLTVLYWDMTHKECLSVTVELLTSQHLNVIYTAQSQLASNGARLDMFSTPFLQEGLDLEKSINFSVVAPQKVDRQQKPSDRLAAVWKILYQQALRYRSCLHKPLVSNGQQLNEKKHEECWSSCLIAQIQTAMQTSGMTLGGMRKLKPIRGEEHFLFGSYSDALKFWQSSLQKETEKDGGRTRFLQTRYCLSILYCHLYHYNLRAAHGLCDRLARWVLRHSQLYSEDVHTLTDECCFHERWPFCNINNEAAYAVIQSMARFMAAYFTNQPLFVLPPHHVDILPPLHGKPDCLPRVIPLQHSYLARMVRDQHLSSVWTVEYALDLLLIGGLLPEAVWFAHTLGDWKMAVSLGVAYNFYGRTTFNLPRLKLRELKIPSQLRPTQIFKTKLQSLIGQKSHPEGLITVGADPRSGDVKGCKRFTDSIEEEDADSLFNSIQEILKAAVMAESDVLSETFIVLLQTAKELSTKLSAIVPHGLYLPAPPLYCPQPAPDIKDVPDDIALRTELMTRQSLSSVLQRMLLLFSAAHCSLSAAQWYIRKLKHCRKVMNKIQLKGSLPLLSPFPESLLKYLNTRNYLHARGANRGGQPDPVILRTIHCFRELCGLCWMFHVREMLSVNCRKYQLARNTGKDLQGYKETEEYNAAAIRYCIEALEWACRFLPFSRFINAEEVVQDVILSLVAELPPIKKVADILVKAFPEQEESVRVALREKYSSLLKNLRHLTLKGGDREDEQESDKD
ncbi:ciliogenesis and planar polarity effector 1-like [Erpetoichthys calabaricus]|uniref:ciliogenesis and planar polarity effector 1-like n=1 Tax=Erpetoichthys calabaricus TaxID=27687 RepID=UPI00223420C8|nr:ciliogenesis and planar polarity effector 1-like [Erpetoichthys calabaricus]